MEYLLFLARFLQKFSIFDLLNVIFYHFKDCELIVGVILVSKAVSNMLILVKFRKYSATNFKTALSEKLEPQQKNNSEFLEPSI